LGVNDRDKHEATPKKKTLGGPLPIKPGRRGKGVSKELERTLKWQRGMVDGGVRKRAEFAGSGKEDVLRDSYKRIPKTKTKETKKKKKKKIKELQRGEPKINNDHKKQDTCSCGGGGGRGRVGDVVGGRGNRAGGWGGTGIEVRWGGKNRRRVDSCRRTRM